MTEKKRKKECKKALVLTNRAIIREARNTDNPFRVQRICDDVMSSQMEKLEKMGIHRRYFPALAAKYFIIHAKWGDRIFFTKLLKLMRSLKTPKW